MYASHERRREKGGKEGRKAKDREKKIKNKKWILLIDNWNTHY